LDVGLRVGNELDGTRVGMIVGDLEGFAVVNAVGTRVGLIEGAGDGFVVGIAVGTREGLTEGAVDGFAVSKLDGGAVVGNGVGTYMNFESLGVHGGSKTAFPCCVVVLKPFIITWPKNVLLSAGSCVKSVQNTLYEPHAL